MILDFIILLTGWVHVFIAPYTKVEESFNLHATHDVLFYGVSPASLGRYDHFTFPGAVPRTFIGSIILAWLSAPVIHLATWFNLVNSKLDLQIIIRLVLSTATSLPQIHLLHTINSAYGLPTSLVYTMLSCTQFHLPFWTSRTIPNSFALVPAVLSTSLLLPRYPSSKRPSQKRLDVAVGLLVATAVVFRAELSALLFPIVVQYWMQGCVSFGRLFRVGIVSGLISLAATVFIDSYFWRPDHLLWPEFAGIYFNVVQGKSAEWGVSPVYEYITVHLPKLLLASLPLCLVTLLALRRKARVGGIVMPAVSFVMLMSCLGHKEWRFIVYVIPAFNIAAARGGLYLVSALKSTVRGRVAILAFVVLILGNILTTTIFTITSAANYPGGMALVQFNNMYKDQNHVHVHICDLAAQTGASLFLQENSPPFLPHMSRNRTWVYDKRDLERTVGSLVSSPKLVIPGNVTHLILEPHEPIDTRFWKTVLSVEAFERWEIRWDVWRGLATLAATRNVNEVMPLKMVMATKLLLVERVHG